MEKLSMSSKDIAKKIIWEAIIISILFYLINRIIINPFISNIKDPILLIVIKSIISTVFLIIEFFIASNKVTKKYAIVSSDINEIIRNMAIFFIIFLIIIGAYSYFSYNNLLEKTIKMQTGLVKPNIDIILELQKDESKTVDEIIKEIKIKQEEKIRLELSKKYGFIPVVVFAYNIFSYSFVLFLQRRWLIKSINE